MWQEVRPGEKQRLAIVDSPTYYMAATNGQPTTRQYYLNPKGYGAKEACRWGDGLQPLGNAAPINVGTGWNGDKGYFSMFNNAPTQQSATLGYNVKIIGGDSVCTYDTTSAIITYNGIPHHALGPRADGCTVGVSPKATVTYVLFP